MLSRKIWFTVALTALRLEAAIADETKAEAPRLKELDIRPVDWDSTSENVRAVLTSAANELWVYFSGRSLEPILVEPRDVDGPIVLFDLGPNSEYQIHLDTGANLWSQWVYQFAHEFGHILSSYDKVKHQNKWFEETICEVASLFVLRRMADRWDNDSSPGSWKQYAPSLREYAEDKLRKGEKLPEGITLAKWYEANALHLAETCCDRDKNRLVATQLLPLFEKTPEHWEVITWLAKAKKGHSESLADFFKAWQTNCPENHRAFVAAVAEKFAIDLSNTRRPPTTDASASSAE